MSIFVTSDWHLGHDRQFVYKPRGFNNVQEMNEAIIERHNRLVKPDDDVYVLGDLALGPHENVDLIKRMNGKLHIVYGNHDTIVRQALYAQLPNVVETAWAIMLNYKKYHFYMTHFPCNTGNLQKESLKQMTLNLYGHTHQTNKFYEDRPYMYCVDVDAHNCYPINLDDIISDMNDKVRECKDFLDVEPESKPEPQQLNTLARCYKCVYSWPLCGNNFENCKSYKRDPPDGGYYG